MTGVQTCALPIFYAPLILVEEEGGPGAGGGMWGEKNAGGPSGGDGGPPGPGWYAAPPGASGPQHPYRAYTTLRVPSKLSSHYSDKRGSADSLVEAVRMEGESGGWDGGGKRI